MAIEPNTTGVLIPVRWRKIYVASSWRNAIQPEVVITLRLDGHVVYDFKNPRKGYSGFSWSEIDPKWKEWSASQYVAALDHPKAKHGFASDFNAMKWADVCVLVLPCGRSAHLELGWMAGAGADDDFDARRGGTGANGQDGRPYLHIAG